MQAQSCKFKTSPALAFNWGLGSSKQFSKVAKRLTFNSSNWDNFQEGDFLKKHFGHGWTCWAICYKSEMHLLTLSVLRHCMQGKKYADDRPETVSFYAQQER